MTDNNKSKPRKGQRVRVTFDATYECDVAFTGATVDAYVLVDNVTHGAPKGATIEPIEDLRPGDVYRDPDGYLLIYSPEQNVHPDREPVDWYVREDDGAVRRVVDRVLQRPLTLLVRDGKPVAS